MPISTPSKWYERKAPTLQIDILNAIATEGQLSKTMAKQLTPSHYPDVSNAIDELVKRQFIESKLTSPIHPKSNHKRFFQLTYKGLQAFIDGKPFPTDFWKAIYWFCNLSKRRIDWETFSALYLRFQNIYLGYTPHHEHFFQFRFIDILFEKWLKDNDKIKNMVRDMGAIVSQRILECLGVNRSLTFDELCYYIEEQRSNFEHRVLEDEGNRHTRFGNESSNRVVPQDEIKRALEEFTLPENYAEPYYLHRPDVRYELDQKLNLYVDFIQHLVVVPRFDEKGEIRYELSLFGLALLLSVRAPEYLKHRKVFYNNLEFGEFCTKLSTNYHDKLPLVFGKWDSLSKETLGDYRGASEILHDLFYDHTSKAMIESSVISGGVKEYYESIKALSDWAYPRLEKIHEDGEKLLQELGESNDCYCNKMISRKIDEIFNSLRQRNLHKFMESLRVGSGADSPTKDPHRIYANELVHIEKALAEEISFLFYMFLYVRDIFRRSRIEPIYSTYFPAIFKPVTWIQTVHLINGVPMTESRQEIRTEDIDPLQSSVNIIRKHEDVQQLLGSWIDDATKFQNDVQSKLSRLKDHARIGQ